MKKVHVVRHVVHPLEPPPDHLCHRPQAGASSTYHQLGMLAQVRGDYPEAQRRYEQSLQIKERLGDQAGAATTRSQLGFLRAAQGRPREAVRLHVAALAVRISLGVPQAGIDARALRELRSQLGEDVFGAEASQVLDAESVTDLKELLAQVEQPDGPPG